MLGGINLESSSDGSEILRNYISSDTSIDISFLLGETEDIGDANWMLEDANQLLEEVAELIPDLAMSSSETISDTD